MKKVLILLIIAIISFSSCYYPYTDLADDAEVISIPYLFEVSGGNIANTECWCSSGYNNDVGTALEIIWPLSTGLNLPAVQQQMQVVSTSANDAAAGTGMQQIRIYYLDSLYNEYTTDVTLNGLVPVNTTVSNIYRIQYIRAIATGSSGFAAGDIYVQSVGGATTYNLIATGYGKDRTLIYTVPEGKRLCITSVKVSSGSGNKLAVVRSVLSANYNFIEKVPADTLETFFEIITQDNAIVYYFELPVCLPEETTIFGAAVSDVTGAKIFVSVRGYLQND